MMKFRLTLLLALFALCTALFVNTVQAAKRQAFKPVHTEEQILNRLRENNYGVERIQTKPILLYRISWEKNRQVYFRPVDDIDDVIVSSKVELVKTDQATTSSKSMPTFRYYYSFEKTPTNPVLSIFCYAFEVSINNISRSDISEISNSELWTHSEQSSDDEVQVVWEPLIGMAISRNLPVISYKEFTFQCPSVPGITTARVRRHEGEDDATNTDKKNKMAIPLSGEEIVPDLTGKVIGPEAIPADWDTLKLTQRLESLTSECIKLGWLDESAAKPLKQHLTDSQTALQKNQQSQAKQAIQAFADTLKRMEKETKPSNPSQEPLLTQEAATLLGTNAAYLLTKL